MPFPTGNNHAISIHNCSWHSISSFHWTALFFASHHGYIEICKMLLSQPNIEINNKDIRMKKLFNRIYHESFHDISKYLSLFMGLKLNLSLDSVN